MRSLERGYQPGMASDARQSEWSSAEVDAVTGTVTVNLSGGAVRSSTLDIALSRPTPRTARLARVSLLELSGGAGTLTSRTTQQHLALR